VRPALSRRGLLLVLLLAACKERTPTQIVLAVLTDLAVPTELDSVSIKVEHRGKLQVDVSHPLTPMAAGAITLPATLVLLPGSDLSQPVLIKIAGKRGISLVAERLAQLRFSEGRAPLVRLALLRRCSGVTCATGLSCGEQGCASIELDPSQLPDYTPEEALRGLDASTGDGPKGDGPRPDGPRPDGPRPDGSPTADLPKPLHDRTVDQRKPDTGIKPDTLKPDACAPTCSAVCNANNGCGAKCYGDNDVEPCTQAEYALWRCVLSLGAQGLGTPISQVCQKSPSKGNALYWVTYNVNPSDCSKCCGPLGVTPAPCKT
jgi:hypothetical protein